MPSSNCQSCDMPLPKNGSKNGTEAGGAKNEKFCSFCYSQGKFVEPNLTVEQMKLKVESKMREMKIPGFLARLLSRNVPKLERWR